MNIGKHLNFPIRTILRCSKGAQIITILNCSKGREGSYKPSELYIAFLYLELGRFDASMATFFTVHGWTFATTQSCLVVMSVNKKNSFLNWLHLTGKDVSLWLSHCQVLTSLVVLLQQLSALETNGSWTVKNVGSVDQTQLTLFQYRSRRWRWTREMFHRS